MTKTKEEISDFINGTLSSLVVVEDNNGQVVISLDGKATDLIYLIAKSIQDVSESMNTTPKEITRMILLGLDGIEDKLTDKLRLVYEDSVMSVTYACPTCGDTDVEFKSNFCSECGEDLRNCTWEPNDWYD